jgi:hypothetical protein
MADHAESERGRARNIYIPADLDRELQGASQRTGIPVSRILQQGARLRLAQLAPLEETAAATSRRRAAKGAGAERKVTK